MLNLVADIRLRRAGDTMETNRPHSVATAGERGRWALVEVTCIYEIAPEFVALPGHTFREMNTEIADTKAATASVRENNTKSINLRAD